jgi:basic membrane lipoprotein Med (substrate-binding protein (PBP1-ABC) superfamily)
LTFEEGAETILRLAGADQQGRKRLIISTDQGYSEYLRDAVSQGKIVNTDSTKLLIFDGDFKHKDVHIAHVSYYGMMYKAGYIAGKMNDVENVRLYLANDTYRYIREGRDGFIEGFSLNKADTVDVYDYSTINDDDTEGFMMRNMAYMSDAHECSKDNYDMILPICGETIMGFLRYNRENPGKFYTVGVGADMSIYSSDVPFSCVEHLDRIVSECVKDWMDNRLEPYRKFGLDEGWVELTISQQYKSLLEPLSREIHKQATEKEDHYAE